MSSTGRASERNALGDYPTPRWCVHRLLEGVELPGGPWLEPCAGAGSIIRAVGSVRSDVGWAANEINPSYVQALRTLGVSAVTTMDARDFIVRREPRVIITNPPFELSLPILWRCLAVSGALTVFLQRLNWCCGPRRALFRQLLPSVYPLPDRPSFVDVVNKKTGKLEAGTDSIEYAWFVFDGLGQFRVLGDTPAEVRRAEIEERRAAQPLLVAA